MYLNSIILAGGPLIALFVKSSYAQGCCISTPGGTNCPIPNQRIDLYDDENCQGNSGWSCEDISSCVCCGTDRAFESCGATPGDVKIAAFARENNDPSNLCKIFLGSANNCYSDEIASINGCRWERPDQSKRDLMDPFGSLAGMAKNRRDVEIRDASEKGKCQAPSHAFVERDGKRYVLPADHPEAEVFKMMARGPERVAHLMKHATEVRDIE